VKDLENLLQGRDPTMSDFMKELPILLGEIRDFMHNINDHFSQNTPELKDIDVPVLP
jgi:hypothetical protein